MASSGPRPVCVLRARTSPAISRKGSCEHRNQPRAGPVETQVARRHRSPSCSPGDRVFAGLADGAGVLILVVLAGVAAFLLVEAAAGAHRALREHPRRSRASSPTSVRWSSAPCSPRSSRCVIATPLAVVGRAVHHALRAAAARPGPRLRGRPARRGPQHRLRALGAPRSLAPAVVPRMHVAGGQPRVHPAVRRPGRRLPGARCWSAGVVLAVMILPIITAVSREVFLQTPTLHEEAALALGATRWEMIRMAVLPFGRSGIISGAMLGLGRALGETMAVAIVLSVSGGDHVQPDQHRQPVHDRRQHRAAVPRGQPGIGVNILIASGLVLFVITLAVNCHRALHRQPAPRVLGGQLMTSTPPSAPDERARSRRRRADSTQRAAAQLDGSWRASRRAAVVVGAAAGPRRVQRRARSSRHGRALRGGLLRRLAAWSRAGARRPTGSSPLIVTSRSCSR